MFLCPKSIKSKTSLLATSLWDCKDGIESFTSPENSAIQITSPPSVSKVCRHFVFKLYKPIAGALYLPHHERRRTVARELPILVPIALSLLLAKAVGPWLSSITSPCSRKESALLPRNFSGAGRPKSREWRKSSLVLAGENVSRPTERGEKDWGRKWVPTQSLGRVGVGLWSGFAVSEATSYKE